MTSDFTPLPQLAEGDYVATLTQCFKAPPRFSRCNLNMDFDIPTGDFGSVRLRAYFQVKWIDDGTFKAGPKSRYFRTYQVCFGPADSDIFSIDSFPLGKYLVEVVSVDRDALGEGLDPVNQYSKVGAIKGVAQND